MTNKAPKGFAIVRSAGANAGQVLSVHRSFQAAARKQKPTFERLCKVFDRDVKRGDKRPDLLENNGGYGYC
jgi:hypothetical protein